MANKNIPILCDDFTCTGCGACENICPVDAIKLLPNKEGFGVPSIDSNKCIGCLKCEKCCPVINNKEINYGNEPKVYAAWNNDAKIRKGSSSGGIFSALAETIIKKGGVVCGAAYDASMNVNHIIIDSIDDIVKLRGSKYVQSNINKVYREIKEYLKKDKLVLFVGTPCQVSGLKNYIVKDFDNLYCCDFICHGVPSQLLFNKYIKWIENKNNIKISHFNFRHKIKGWYDASRVYNNKTILKGLDDAYFIWFNKNLSLRESCYKCPAIGLPRKGDITIADFWRIGMRNKFHSLKEINKGISLIVTNNNKGSLLLKFISEKISHEERSIDEAIYGNKPMIVPAYRPQNRENFYNDLHNYTFNDFINIYSNINIKQKIINFLKERFPKYFVLIFRNIIHLITFYKNGNKTL